MSPWEARLPSCTQLYLGYVLRGVSNAARYSAQTREENLKLWLKEKRRKDFIFYASYKNLSYFLKFSEGHIHICTSLDSQALVRSLVPQVLAWHWYLSSCHSCPDPVSSDAPHRSLTHGLVLWEVC